MVLFVEIVSFLYFYSMYLDLIRVSSVEEAGTKITGQTCSVNDFLGFVCKFLLLILCYNNFVEC